MNALDVLLLTMLGLAGTYGYLRGLWVAVCEFAGFVVGLVAGAVYSPAIVDFLGVHDPAWRQFTGLMVITLGLSVGTSLGFLAGTPLRRWLVGRRLLGPLDSVLGAVVAIGLTVGAAWLAALSFSAGPSQDLAGLVQGSAILGRINDVAPTAPGFVTRVEKLLSQQLSSNLFVGPEPSLPSPLRIDPASASSAGVNAAAAVTVRVRGNGCGGIVEGSGFPIGPGLILTNAHVVAGTRTTTVNVSGSAQRLAGQVILFDPDRDLAVVSVQGLNLAPLTPGSASQGTAGAAIGYPGGGPLTVVPAIVDGSLSAQGRDIFDEDLVTRQILVIEADVRPGDSGGPLVDSEGRLLGVVYAAATSQAGRGYALSLTEIQPILDELKSGRTIIDPRRAICAG
jgi:S1-C subfamily serine protease